MITDNASAVLVGTAIGFALVFALLMVVHADVLWWPTRELFARFVEMARTMITRGDRR